MNQDINKEIKSQFKDEFNDLIDEFFDDITKKSSEHSDTNMPSLTEIESLWGKLTVETRDLYAKMIRQSPVWMNQRLSH